MNEGKAREKALTERPAATWLISLLSHGTSFWSLGCSPGVKEAQPGVLMSHTRPNPGNVEAHAKAIEINPSTIEVHPATMQTKPVAIAAHPGAIRLTILPRCISLEQ